MSQNTNVLLAPVTYNRSDYTALRAHCLKIPIAKIAGLYYSDDSPQVEMGLERFLLAMRADLIERCIVKNPATAEILQGARQGGAITSRALEILIKAADAPAPVPHPDHPVSQWFRPLAAKALKAEHIHTLADLTASMTNRGSSWWRGLRRIGVHRAKVMHAWVLRHERTLGMTYAVDLMVPPRLSKIVVDPENDNPLAPIERLVAIQIEKALAQPLWDELIERLEASGNHPERVQERVALAMMLLLGDSGLRRAEVASAQRIALLRSKWSTEVFELTVLGKRNVYRVVPVSSRTIKALRRHWRDRGLDFDSQNAEGALLAPVVVPSHAAASARHRGGGAQSGYTTDGLYKPFQSAIKRLRLDHTVDKAFSLDDLAALSKASPHALRHTFGTLAVAEGMPIDVVQAVLGHKDSATTAIYVQAKTKLVVEEGAKYFAKKQGKPP
jgi:integrase